MYSPIVQSKEPEAYLPALQSSSGAGSGIGKSIAEAFAREGASVAIADINFGAARAVSEEINSAGGRATATQMDVTDEDQVNAGLALLASLLGQLLSATDTLCTSLHRP